MSSRGATVAKIEDHIKRDPFDFPPNTKTVNYLGVEYKFRELTVAETDQAREDSTNDETKIIDGRLMTRLMICTAATEPEMNMEQLSKLPQRLYSAIVDAVNDLNDPDALAEEAKGKNS